MNRTPNRTAALARCYAAFLLSGMGSLMVGSLLPYLRAAYDLDYGFSGLLLSAQPVGNLIATLLAGVLPLYLGRRRSVLLLTVWMPVAYLLFSTASLPVLLLAACFCTGLARGGGANFCNVSVSTLAGENPGALNLLHGAFALGALSAPFLLIGSERLTGSFRPGVFVMLAFALLQFALYCRASRDPLPEPARGGLRGADYSFLRSVNFWVSGLILLFYISAEYAITGWLVTYMKDSGVFTAAMSQMMSSLLWVDILLGRLLVASLSRRLSQNQLLFMGGAGFFAFFLVVFHAVSPVPAAIGIAGLGFFMAGIYPTTFSCVSRELAGNDLAASMLIMLGSIGGIAAPALIGQIAARVGIVGGMRTVIVLTSVTFVLILLRVLIFRRKRKPD